MTEKPVDPGSSGQEIVEIPTDSAFSEPEQQAPDTSGTTGLFGQPSPRAPEPEPVPDRSKDPMTWDEMKETFATAAQRIAEGPLLVMRQGFHTILGAVGSAANAAGEEFEKPTITRPEKRKD